MRRDLSKVLPMVAAAGLLMAVAACGGKKVAPPPPPPPAPAPVQATPTPQPPPPPAPRPQPTPVPPPPPQTPTESELWNKLSLDELNNQHNLDDVFFEYDKSDLSDAARASLQKNASYLQKWQTA